MHRKQILIAIAALITTVVMLFCLVSVQQRRKEGKESYELMIEARDNLYVGMTRIEVDQYVHTAWRHYFCDNVSFSISVYLFGSHNLNRAGTLYLRFEKKGVETLDEITSVDHSMLPQFERCEILEK